MIRNGLTAIRDTLRRYFGARPNGEEIVHITSPGKGVEGQRDYLGIMFIALEPEPHLQNDRQGFSLDANAVFMLYSAFSSYDESLRYLSGCLACMQEKNHFSRADFPHLALPADSLLVEPYFFPLVHHIQTWNPFMDDSIPFMFYKLRSLRYRSKVPEAPPASGLDLSTREGT